MNNNKSLKIFNDRLNDFTDFKNDIIWMIENGDKEENKMALDYLSKIITLDKTFKDFDFLDFFNTIKAFSGDIADGDTDLSWSMHDNLLNALYGYTYSELVKKGMNEDYLDSLESVYEGSWNDAEDGFWIEVKGFFGQVINYTITPELLTNQNLLIKSLDNLVENLYLELR